MMANHEARAEASLERLVLQHEVERFLYLEANLLDERRFEEWLELLAEDVRYWMPIARNVRFGEQEHEYTRAGEDIAWFDEGKETLRQRAHQILTGIHWAEEPLSRTSHVVTNVLVEEALPSFAQPTEVQVTSRFLVYRNRLQDETDVLVGKRRDALRKFDGGWLIARRDVYLDQAVLLAKNLTTFF